MIPKECERQFQIELGEYRQNEDKRSWDRMWSLVQVCCTNLAKSKLRGVTCPDFDGKIMDATLKCMQKIRDGENPKKLSSFCYFPVIGVIWDRKLQKEERNISYEAWCSYELGNEEKGQ